MKAFFTGHRYVNGNLPRWYIGVDKLITEAYKRGARHFYSGMALGADQLAAEILQTRKCKWTAVIPCADQDELWPYKQKRRYRKLLKSAPEQVVLYDKYSNGVMQARNAWMVKRSQLCLAIWDGCDEGGTAMTVNMARSKMLPILRLNPKTGEITIVEPPIVQLSLF